MMPFTLPTSIQALFPFLKAQHFLCVNVLLRQGRASALRTELLSRLLYVFKCLIIGSNVHEPVAALI